jgi:phosphorylcholine metabolism protein LicD
MQRFCLGKSLSGGAVNSVKHGLQKMIYKYVYHSPSASLLFDIYQRAAGRYAGRGTQKVEHLAFGHHDNFVWQRSDWADSVLLDFEELKLNAPIGYEAVLRQQYGNFIQIPEDKSTHDYFEFDPDVSYECFFNR